jgi:hypothetical protein
MLPWMLWGWLHRYGRGSSMSGLAPIKIDATLDLCRAKDATWEDFERILLVEETLYPHLMEPRDGQDYEKPSKPKK